MALDSGFITSGNDVHSILDNTGKTKMDYFAELKTPAELFSEFTDYLESRLPSMESDLGVEFDVIEGGDYPMAINESNHSATATITYCGIEIGSVVVSDCLNKESFSDSPISWLFLPFENFYELDISLVSINGLGINEDYETQKEHLYFMNLQKKDSERNYYDYIFETESTVLMCLYTDNKLNSFTLKIKNQ